MTDAELEAIENCCKTGKLETDGIGTIKLLLSELRAARAFIASFKEYQLSYHYQQCGCGQYPTTPSDPDCADCRLVNVLAAYEAPRR